MAWTVILETEKKKAIATLPCEFYSSLSKSPDEFRLLRYLDPYGDTVFNRLQMDDLIDDLQQLKKMETNPLIDEMLLLAERCKQEAHTYLSFYGD